MTIILADVRQKNIRRRGMSQNPFYINKSSSQSLRVFLEAPFSWKLLKIGSDSVRGIIKKSSSYKYIDLPLTTPNIPQFQTTTLF